MDLNNNIKSIIYKYYTYSDIQIQEFTKEWKEKIKDVNIFFDIKMSDYYNDCYHCKVKNHKNFECPMFYSSVHIINSIKMKN